MRSRTAISRKHVYHGVPRNPADEVTEGRARCICGRSVLILPSGRLRKHRTPTGDDCTHQANYGPQVHLDELPPVVFDRPKRQWL